MRFSRDQRAFGVALIVVCSLLLVGASRATAQQQDPLAGLDADVYQIAAAVERGDAQALIDRLHPGTVIQTGYPGHGEERPTSEAAARIPQLIVSDTSASDAMGSGAYRLVAVWLPESADPPVALVGSGIGPGVQTAGVERVTTIFGLEEVAGNWVIRSYGHIGGYEGMGRGVESALAFLDHLKTQGDYREVTGPLAPAPPDTGSGLVVASRDAPAWPVWVMLAALGVMAAVRVRYRR
jgi:hypothetical protein